jgi:hypothetical protein
MLGTLRHFVGRGPLIPDDEVEWQLACFRWLLCGTGGFGRFQHAVLVLPTDEYFPQRGLRIGALEQALFRQVKEHAGMAAWRCRLEVQKADPSPHVAPTVIIHGSPRSPLGTFRRDKKRAVITYSPDSTADPVAFVATLAHELAHYLISEIRDPPPGGHQHMEFATDMAAVFLGFGVFLTNAAFTFSQYQGGGTQGWSARSQGYLSESQLLHATALFTVLLGIEPSRAMAHLDSHLRRPYKAACGKLAGADSPVHTLRATPPIEGDTREIATRSSGRGVTKCPK